MPIVFCFVLIIEPINALGKILKQYQSKWKIKVSHLSGPIVNTTGRYPAQIHSAVLSPLPGLLGALRLAPETFLHRMVLGPMSERAQSAWGL